jgi:hypothetical protein
MDPCLYIPRSAYVTAPRTVHGQEDVIWIGLRIYLIWYVMNTRIYTVLYSYMFWCNIASQYIPTQPRVYGCLLWVINYKWDQIQHGLAFAKLLALHTIYVVIARALD